jgi:AAA+ superfamily predicted ATPase
LDLQENLTMTNTERPPQTNDISLDLAYLHAQMVRIDVMIQREVHRWQLSGQNMEDNFRGLYVSDSDAESLLGRPFATSWGQTQAGDGSIENIKAQFDRAEEQIQQVLAVCKEQNFQPKLLYLVQTFGLDQIDLDILLVCLAPALDLKYERLYGYLQDDVTRKRPMVNLALDLLGKPGVQRYDLWQHFLDQSPLFRYRFIERINDGGKQNLLTQVLLVDDVLVNWLLGHYEPAAELGVSARLLHPNENKADHLLAPPIEQILPAGGLSNHTLVFYGPDLARKEAAARQLAAWLHRPWLSINLEDTTDISLDLVLKLALRDARLNQSIPFISGWDALIGEENMLPQAVLRMLSSYEDIAIIASEKQLQLRALPAGHSFIWLNFEQPAFKQRQQVWQHFLGNETLNQLDIDAVAGQFQLTVEQIRDAFLTARDAAAQRGEPISDADLFTAARSYSNRRLTNLASKIEPRYTWEDIVLPEDQINILKEIINTVRQRPLVLEEWGLKRKLASSAGVATLFAGPPGTGKTMGAEVIARELGLDLYKIDLSSVVSKYIGETEKNISKIFSEAETSNAILFFDEADALFGKRSEVRDSHDRYANIEISYLLQRMEAYDGITILATNLRANLDEAFTRRLQFIVDFPFPQEADRLRIWQALFPENVPCENDIDFAQLAKRFRIAGANIRNIIVSAVFLAASDGQKIGMRHLLHGTHRELQKMRRLIEDETLTMSS